MFIFMLFVNFVINVRNDDDDNDIIIMKNSTFLEKIQIRTKAPFIAKLP